MNAAPEAGDQRRAAKNQESFLARQAHNAQHEHREAQTGRTQYKGQRPLFLPVKRNANGPQKNRAQAEADRGRERGAEKNRERLGHYCANPARMRMKPNWAPSVFDTQTLSISSAAKFNAFR